MFRNTHALKYILVSKNTGLRLIGQDIVQLWKMTVWQLSLHPGRTVSLHLQSLNCRNLNLGMITESYWNSQPSSLDVSLHGEYVSGIQVRYIVLAGWCCFQASAIFRSSRKYPEEDHQPIMGKQFGIT